MHQIEQGLDQAHLSARASYWHGRQCPRDHLHSSLPHLQLAALVVAIIMAAAGTPAITVRKPPCVFATQNTEFCSSLSTSTAMLHCYVPKLAN